MAVDPELVRRARQDREARAERAALRDAGEADRALASRTAQRRLAASLGALVVAVVALFGVGLAGPGDLALRICLRLAIGLGGVGLAGAVLNGARLLGAHLPEPAVRAIAIAVIFVACAVTASLLWELLRVV